MAGVIPVCLKLQVQMYGNFNQFYQMGELIFLFKIVLNFWNCN